MEHSYKETKHTNDNIYIKSLFYGSILSLSIVTSSTAEGVSGNSSVNNKTFTKAEFQECNKNIQLLAKTEKQLNTQRNQLISLQKEITQLVQDRTDMNNEVDLHNQQSVDHYNQLNNDIHQLSQQFYDNGKTFNQDVKRYQADKSQSITNCQGKQYYK